MKCKRLGILNLQIKVCGEKLQCKKAKEFQRMGEDFVKNRNVKNMNMKDMNLKCNKVKTNVEM